MMSSLDLAMAMESLRHQADELLSKQIPFTIEVSYDGLHLMTSLKEIRPPQATQWVAVVKEKEEEKIGA
jgi:hypothetical protein